MSTIVGRDDERGAVARFLAATGSGPAILSIDGEAGIGKSELRRHAAGLARESGALVLATSPDESDASLSFVGLTDLLTPIAASDLDVLPAPQRSALDAAMLRSPSGGEPHDQRAIGTALVTLLGHLAADRPVVAQLDDAQWLDAPSRTAIEFAFARVDGRVGLMTCRRMPGRASEAPNWTRTGVWHEHLQLSGLSLAATFVLIRERLGLALPRLRLSRIWEASQGNPLLALELARALTGDEQLLGELAVPDRLLDLLIARVTALPATGVEAALAVACGGRLTVGEIRRLGHEAGLVAAEEAGVLTIVGDRATFTHPLLASASLAAASGPKRRAAHAAIAGVAPSAEARARHLALADPSPDPRIADALEQATDEAARRGATSTSIELARLAVERTAGGGSDAMWRRRATLARHLYMAGESQAAAAVLADRATMCPPGARRAEVELIMVEIAFQTVTTADAERAARLALEHAVDPTTRARALLSLDVVDRRNHDLRRIDEALECLASVESPDRPTLAWARISELYTRQLAGEPVDPDEIDEVVALERQDRIWRSTDNAAANRPVLLSWIDHPQAALIALDELETRATEEGNEGSMPYFLGHRASCLIALARLDDAEAVARRHQLHAEATSQIGQEFQARYLLAAAAVLRDPVAALDEVRGLLREADATGDEWMGDRIASLVGVAELANEDAAEARRHLDRWHDASRRNGERGPAVRRCYVDYVEALLADGDRTAARALADWLLVAARRAERRVPEAAALHGLALIAGDEGDLARALARVDEALSCGESAMNDLERGRALVTRGVVLRRLRRKRAAADALATARELFASAGASYLIDRVDAESARVGRRSGDRWELTVTERRVAELAAQGHTNREVADLLFISAKTVEANLGRVYRKLGIRSRAELGARMAGPAENRRGSK